ncbi:hypothetical protein G9A89_020077 [Geosiphon pyriformis]|nr:hypothetical protein G9A89_020077 [Geosiphon pyriformis]
MNPRTGFARKSMGGKVPTKIRKPGTIIRPGGIKSRRLSKRRDSIKLVKEIIEMRDIEGENFVRVLFNDSSNQSQWVNLKNLRNYEHLMQSYRRKQKGKQREDDLAKDQVTPFSIYNIQFNKNLAPSQGELSETSGYSPLKTGERLVQKNDASSSIPLSSPKVNNVSENSRPISRQNFLQTKNQIKSKKDSNNEKEKKHGSEKPTSLAKKIFISQENDTASEENNEERKDPNTNNKRNCQNIGITRRDWEGVIVDRQTRRLFANVAIKRICGKIFQKETILWLAKPIEFHQAKRFIGDSAAHLAVFSIQTDRNDFQGLNNLDDLFFDYLENKLVGSLRLNFMPSLHLFMFPLGQEARKIFNFGDKTKHRIIIAPLNVELSPSLRTPRFKGPRFWIFGNLQNPEIANLIFVLRSLGARFVYSMKKTIDIQVYSKCPFWINLSISQAANFKSFDGNLLYRVQQDVSQYFPQRRSKCTNDDWFVILHPDIIECLEGSTDPAEIEKAHYALIHIRSAAFSQSRNISDEATSLFWTLLKISVGDYIFTKRFFILIGNEEEIPVKNSNTVTAVK